jgi:hypothetical protein
MLTLSVKASRDHPLPGEPHPAPPSPLRSLVSSFLLSCRIKFGRHDLVGQVKPDGTLVGSCNLNWNGVGVQVLRNEYLLVVQEDWNAQLFFRVGGKWMHCVSLLKCICIYSPRGVPRYRYRDRCIKKSNMGDDIGCWIQSVLYKKM